MEDGVFCRFQDLKGGRYGQTMVFLLVVLIILLAAAVSVVHIGRIGVRRVRTANAADASALAAASSLASVGMNIYDMNRILRQEYLTFALYIEASSIFKRSCKRTWCPKDPGSIPGKCPQFTTDFAIYMAYIVKAQWLDYLMLIYTAHEGFLAAHAAGHAMAFANVGIDEAVRRRLPSGDIVPSRLSMWLAGNAVSDPQPTPPVIPDGNMDEISYTFRWRSYSADPITGKEVQEDKPNEVTSYVKFTDCSLELYPRLLPPLVKKYSFTYAGWSNRYLFPCTPWCCNCGCCNCTPCCIYDDGQTDLSCNQKDVQGWKNWMDEVEFDSRWVATPGFLLAEWLTKIYDWLKGPGAEDCPAKVNINQIIYTVVALIVGPVRVISKVPPLQWPLSYANPGLECACSLSNAFRCPRHCPATYPACATISWLVPVPWIQDITNIKDCNDSKNIKIETHVTYVEPSREMGFWKRKRTVVTSSAKAKICKKGTFETFSPGGYEVQAELIETN